MASGRPGRWRSGSPERGRADRVGLAQKQLAACIVARQRDREREADQQREQAEERALDRGDMCTDLIVAAIETLLPHPAADLGGGKEQDRGGEIGDPLADAVSHSLFMDGY